MSGSALLGPSAVGLWRLAAAGCTCEGRESAAEAACARVLLTATPAPAPAPAAPCTAEAVPCGLLQGPAACQAGIAVCPPAMAAMDGIDGGVLHAWHIADAAYANTRPCTCQLSWCTRKQRRVQSCKIRGQVSVMCTHSMTGSAAKARTHLVVSGRAAALGAKKLLF